MNDQMKKMIKLPMKDFAKKIVCDGDLFLMSGERKFYIMKPGVFVDPSFVKKYAVSNPTFDFESAINPSIKDDFRKLFRELRYLQFERDLRLKCFEILRRFHEVHAAGEHFLSFALAAYEEFCQLPLDEQKRMHETDMHLFRKALYSAAFSVIVGIANDFYHFLVLRDFYTVTFSLDIGLCESNYSYYVSEACNQERKEPGTGRSFLSSEKASGLEVEVFLKHPERSHRFLQELPLLAYPELAEIALYQHELVDGKGFPRGVLKGQISNWEAVVIFADSLVDISPTYDFERNVLHHMTVLKDVKFKDLPVNRVHKKLCLALGHFSEVKESAS